MIFYQQVKLADKWNDINICIFIDNICIYKL